MHVFVDTSAIVALVWARDSHHQEAVRTYRRLVDIRAGMLTTDWILTEAVTLARVRAGYAVARRVGDALLGPGFDVHWVDRDAADDAWRLFEKYRDHDLSLCDCASFVVMRRRRVDTAFAYDEDFRRVGFNLASPDAR